MVISGFLGGVAAKLRSVLVSLWSFLFHDPPSEPLDPSEESVFITGCDSGIGYQCALLLDQLGFRVIAGCLLPSGQGAQTLLAETTNVRVVQLDVTDEDSVQKAFQTVVKSTLDRGLWALVNNAGVMCYGEFEWYTWNQCQKQIDVNLTGTIRVTKTFLPLLRKRKGRILTMSSVNGLLAYPAQSVYCATKFALEGFCDSLRLELRRSGVSVVSLRLGDFARLTNIFADHERDVQEMWARMDEETRRLQGSYFWRFHRVAKKKHGMTSPASFGQSRLFADVAAAVASSRPKDRYLCMPLSQRILVRFLLVLPSAIGDRLLTAVFDRVFGSADSRSA